MTTATINTQNDIRETYTHYDSADYGPLTYTIEWFELYSEQRNCWSSVWSDGGEIVGPSIDQICRGVLAVMPDQFNGQEYCEIVEGDTCPITITPDPAVTGAFFANPRIIFEEGN